MNDTDVAEKEFQLNSIQIKKDQNGNTQDQGDLQVVSKPSRLVYFATFTALCGALAMGTVMGWSSPSIPDMERSDPQIATLNPQTRSFIGSSATLGGIFGGLLAGPAANHVGRRNLIILTAVPFLAGWIPIILARSTTHVLVGRLLTGFCAAMLSSVVPICIAETAPVSVRGFLGTTFQLFACMGTLFIFFCSIWLPWRTLSVISVLPILPLILIMPFMPETPSYLIGRQNRDQVSEEQSFLGRI